MIKVEKGFPKDTKEYLISKCSKCGQYFYVKTTQKNKKCVRCGRTHVVKDIIPSGEIVVGVTAASDRMRERLNSLAVKELGAAPFLRAEREAKKTIKVLVERPSKREKLEISLEEKFTIALDKLAKSYNQVPSYIIEFMHKETSIPLEEFKILLAKYLKSGKIERLSGNYYKFNL